MEEIKINISNGLPKDIIFEDVKENIPIPPKPSKEEIFNQNIDRLEKEFLELTEKNLTIIKETLQGFYGDNWDLQINSLPGLRGRIEKCYSRTASSFKLNDFLNDYNNNTKYTIYIHFPEITIKNSKRQSRILRDLFIRITLTETFKNSMSNYIPSYFGGWRATKEVVEYNSNYGHSHLINFKVEYSSECIFGKFCLGDTKFANICAKLNHEFEEDDFILFCQQLKDYVAWESLEGGPYQRMSDMGSRSNDIQGPPSVDSSVKQSMYIKFLQSNEVKNFVFETYKANGVNYIDAYRLKTDVKFEKLVTSITPQDYLVYFDTSNNTRFVVRNSISNDLATAKNYNSKSNKVYFKFKDQDIKFKLVEPSEDVAKKDIYKDMEKVANTHITYYIADKITGYMNQMIFNDTISVNHNN